MPQVIVTLVCGVMELSTYIQLLAISICIVGKRLDQRIIHQLYV